MSKISLKPNASGTGVFSLEAPNSNVDRTLNLPDEAGTVLTNVSDIESQVKTATNATGSAPVYACRAWVNFDGTGTVSIRESGNVSSITDNGTGDYTVNFATALPDANYAYSTTGREDESGTGAWAALPVPYSRWCRRIDSTMGIFTDMTKAREIKRDMIRAERKPLLEQLDVEYMRAQEAGDTARQQEIAAKKQALRDATVDPVIDAATTPDELKVATPAALQETE